MSLVFSNQIQLIQDQAHAKCSKEVAAFNLGSPGRGSTGPCRNLGQKPGGCFVICVLGNISVAGSDLPFFRIFRSVQNSGFWVVKPSISPFEPVSRMLCRAAVGTAAKSPLSASPAWRLSCLSHPLEGGVGVKVSERTTRRPRGGCLSTEPMTDPATGLRVTQVWLAQTKQKPV